MQSLIDTLDSQGYYVWDNFLSPQQVDALKGCLPDTWKSACIGRNEDVMRESAIRSDKICWLTCELGEPVQQFMSKMEVIRQATNQRFFLGLFEYEAHFAKYNKGDFYQKHLDCFQGNENRRLTTVFYMNDEWSEEDGGELVVYDLEDKELARVTPKSGRLLVFFSEQFPHEVLPTQRERFSIAGWFRINGVKDNYLDIAN
ncbi:SM-20 protein [Vibrio sp. 10N.286.49.C2]|uniref:2OG-Fe(II) oxygenase n=1 Tax=unclassified Vibrio TaxID=2614977 RepID=UPI000C844C10|nr:MULTISPECIES: 2OG-Fe(II) oxygenase [unclassified Vibrio]PMH35160.1 SM-20 protein [Vibrio sp. 10N.286.49.C2]PMH57104.1 SM-20 protein [Vibrio sp. 10N.286.49.B1]PMH77909.1 SM-20 protein [Vibrio sp. 10N.286.48.B7]